MDTVSIVKTFNENIESVKKLIHFDRQVVDLAISSIEELNQFLIDRKQILHPQQNGQRVLDLLRDIRKNDSLKGRYEVINNQAVVLLVSYFGSTITDLFKVVSEYAVDEYGDNGDKRVLGTELKLSVAELLNLTGSLGAEIGELLISKNNISFQDMQSIKREFNQYFGIKIEKTVHVNNIILGQACRHSIVHAAGIINARVLKQVGNATPRTLKESLVENELITFNEDEINMLAQSMTDYVDSLASKVGEYRDSIDLI
ncbi:MAG: hypothetical protein COA63_005330 [Methylophaga sp.]|nr:hypothetical protein [Methylophaga sp.]